jgi:hypothetical protein
VSVIPTDDSQSRESKAVSASTSTDPFALRREDLAGLADAYHRDLRGRKMWAWVGTGFGGMALSVILISVGERMGWPEALGPVFFAMGWAFMLGSFAVVTVKSRRLRARYEIRCPECDVSLLGRLNRAGGLAHAELAIATGRCPACGKEILAP